jgi:hypothetical protein
MDHRRCSGRESKASGRYSPIGGVLRADCLLVLHLGIDGYGHEIGECSTSDLCYQAYILAVRERV